MGINISINFGRGEHGWLPVDFMYKDFELDFSASQVLNNPIEELLYVVNQLQDNEAKRVTWWLEPSAYFFDFTKNGNSFSLTISDIDNLFDRETDPKILLTINGGEEEIIEPIRLALEKLAF